MKFPIPSILLALVASVACAATPPPGALIVNKAGGSGVYTTIQAAVDALSPSSTTPHVIYIHAGTYAEQVYIPPLSALLSIYGQSSAPMSYKANTVTITAGESQKTKPKNDLTATLRVHTTNFKLYNVNVENTFGEGSQAVALSAAATNQGYYGVKLDGFQDTLFADQGAQLYAKSAILGATDFIFGRHCRGWFEGCDLLVKNASVGYITASGRSTDDSSIYVMNQCNIAAAPGNTVKPGVYFLGRPWRNWARVVYQYTSMTNVINPAGWSTWNPDNHQTDHVFFGEFQNNGEGSKGPREKNITTVLTEPISITSVLGSKYESAAWVDTSYLQ